MGVGGLAYKEDLWNSPCLLPFCLPHMYEGFGNLDFRLFLAERFFCISLILGFHTTKTHRIGVSVAGTRVGALGRGPGYLQACC